MRDESVVLRNFGSLLIDFSRVTPDGLACVFSDYHNLKLVVNKWNGMGVIDRLLEQKLIFIETPSLEETKETFELFIESCRSGRGGILLLTAHGILAETLSCSSTYIRCIVFFGIPTKYYLNFLDKARFEYYQKAKGIAKTEYTSFETMRVIGSILGRLLASKSDYLATILADKKYAVHDRIEMLPKWVQACLQATILGPRISITEDTALHLAKGLLQGIKVIEQGIEKMDIS